MQATTVQQQLQDESLGAITHYLKYLIKREAPSKNISTQRASQYVDKNTACNPSEIDDVIESDLVEVDSGTTDVVRDVNVMGPTPSDLENVDLFKTNVEAFNPTAVIEGSTSTSGDNSSDSLESLSQIGKAKAELLQDAGYPTLSDIAAATVDELKEVDLVNDTIATTIKDEAESRIDSWRPIAKRAYEEHNSWVQQKKQDGDPPIAESVPANEVDEPAGEPIGSDTHLYGLPVLDTDENHPYVRPPSRYEPYYRRTLENGETDIECVSRTLAKNNYSPLLVGYPGVAKDVLIKYIAAIRRNPFITINMDQSMISQELFGIHKINPDQSVTFQDGIFPRAYKYGWWIIIDEINAAPPGVLLALQQMLEMDSALYVKESNEYIEPHPAFRVIGTMNPPESGFQGTNELNEALNNRFTGIQIPYPAEESIQTEVDVLHSRINKDRTILDRSTLKTLVNLAVDFRADASQDFGAQHPRLSPRDLMKMAHLADGPNATLEGSAKEVVRNACSTNRHQVESALEKVEDYSL